ncbi:DnaA ATPase domain-containing protein [Candidatus Liberibacter americanus]|uniref:ATPase involved in DNA replication initiation n=1 Tax=Candidatus Liberibacter americanus str. Sao Paulo TaxID=1261131 RepID=U6B9C1_9HYPH|nr:DnaA/Hda family protein [Candidatus Liberibacter americanus]AHA28317.1 ATPase involved in DNA replication initiation [Candidatus Liberibacter americanus str. Sao Paulo]EMS36607.1 hypothetical protein G653_00130 [Candidatus Liberibacter americanus PW_SP]
MKREEQFFLSFPRVADKINRDDLLSHDSIDQAIRIIDAWPSWPSSVIIIVGPSGSGKSFLAKIWSNKSGSRQIYSSAKGLETVQINAQPMMLEDADRINFDDTQLFHIINSIAQHDSSLLITARTFPIEWPVNLPDLCSRLQAATVVKISLPSDDCLEKIIVKMFSDRQIFIDRRIVSYIVQRMERSLVYAESLVDRMDYLSFSRGIGITRSLAAEVLEEMQSSE